MGYCGNVRLYRGTLNGIITERKVGTWKHYRLVEDQTPLMKGVLEQIQPLNGCNCGTDCCHVGGTDNE